MCVVSSNSRHSTQTNVVDGVLLTTPGSHLTSGICLTAAAVAGEITLEPHAVHAHHQLLGAATQGDAPPELVAVVVHPFDLDHRLASPKQQQRPPPAVYVASASPFPTVTNAPNPLLHGYLCVWLKEVEVLVGGWLQTPGPTGRQEPGRWIARERCGEWAAMC